jgi:hypothetical protein
MRRPGNILFSLLALNPDDIALSAPPTDSFICRSNATHIVWKVASSSPQLQDHHKHQQQAIQRRRVFAMDATPTSTTKTYQCTIQTRKDAEKSCMSFLKNNIMAFDEPFLETMGFSLDDDDVVDADGLSNGLVGPTVSLALDAKIRYKWTDDLPPDIFLNYVLNYANLNEARTNWRPLLVDALKFNESDLYQNSLTSPTTKSQESNLNITSVTTWVNKHLWTRLARREDQPIYFKSSQTPLIFDPMSTISFGYASCTGISILFCNALRAVGIPARVAGTPAWYGNRTQGNHNWVEVFVPKSSDNDKDGGGEWKFLEPSPALQDVDTLDNDPCDRWFCDPTRFPVSKVFAATLSSHSEASIGYFPLGWEWDCRDVPAVDRTDYYARICGSCDDISNGEE